MSGVSSRAPSDCHKKKSIFLNHKRTNKEQKNY
ncbi:uncharacterized protein DMAD_09915 [Drosophila madeirensis]|uniref:Uncharacterized protein n=1 Tax=Drosophila madeirensis TaxID=30013 RepID=A0AAU9F851_DROMD